MKIKRITISSAALVFFISLLLLLPGKIAGADITGTCTQPTPYIYEPQSNSTLTGNIAIEIYICPTLVNEMDVFALNSANEYFLGNADQIQGTYYRLWWNTTTVANGSYQLIAKAKTGTASLITISPERPVIVNNQSTNPSNTPAPTPKGKTPSPAITRTAAPTPSPTGGTVINEEGIRTQTNNQIRAALPKTEVPVATPPPVETTANRDLLTNSQLITSLNFQLDQGKPLHLTKIEGRRAADNTKFLQFVGQNYPNSNLTITVKSQPLVMTAKADENGNWSYILEKPLEPGQHEVYVQVNIDGRVEQSGPYPFNIAQAQASLDNPNGSSLDLVDPSKQRVYTYLYISASLVGLAVIILVLFLYFKQIKKKGSQPKS